MGSMSHQGVGEGFQGGSKRGPTVDCTPFKVCGGALFSMLMKTVSTGNADLELDVERNLFTWQKEMKTHFYRFYRSHV